MTNRELLEEKLEDAQFALWMEDFAQLRGEFFLEKNEQLRSDPEAAVPEELRRRNLNTIFRALRKDARTGAMRSGGRILLKFIATAAILMALLVGACALSPTIRAGTLNLLLQMEEGAAFFSFVEDTAHEPNTPSKTPAITMAWLPDGYQQNDFVFDDFRTSVQTCDSAGNIITLSVFYTSHSTQSFDIEDADLREVIAVRGQAGLLVEKNGIIRIMWADPDTGTFLLLDSTAVDGDTLLRVAEGVTVTW